MNSITDLLLWCDTREKIREKKRGGGGGGGVGGEEEEEAARSL